MKLLALLLSCLVLSSCVSYVPDPSLAEVLPDCTKEFGSWVGKPALDMAPAERAKILNSATQWAKSREYFPCNVTVCGAVIDAGPRNVSVFLTGYGDLNPSATVMFSRKRFHLLEETFHESGCPAGVFLPAQGGT